MTHENRQYEKELRDRLNNSTELDDNEIALRDRLNGRLTTLDIDGHTFYIDFPGETIRPKDSFSTAGIPFHCLNYSFNDELLRCELPYDRKTREMVPLNLSIITKIPEDIILIAFPPPERMDPIGFARAKGHSIEEVLRYMPQQAHFTALMLKGENNYLEMRVKQNLRDKNISPLKPKNKPRKISR